MEVLKSPIFHKSESTLCKSEICFKTTNDSYHLLFSLSFSLILEESLKERIFHGELNQNIDLKVFLFFMSLLNL